MMKAMTDAPLVFLGMANVAHYWWCDVQSLLKSRDMELTFSEAFFSDFIDYSVELGLKSSEVDVLPLSDMERVLARRQARATDMYGGCYIARDGQGGIHEVPNTTKLPKGLTLLPESEWSPKLRGSIYQSRYAERYPTVRWSFRWHDYIIVGVPDGIADEFVYEFKSTGSKYLMRFLAPVATCQADLYGMFFGRPRKRVQIHIKDEDRVETIDEPIDTRRAVQTLETFEGLDRGLITPRGTTVAWKCRNCEYPEGCRVYREGDDGK